MEYLLAQWYAVTIRCHRFDVLLVKAVTVKISQISVRALVIRFYKFVYNSVPSIYRRPCIRRDHYNAHCIRRCCDIVLRGQVIGMKDFSASQDVTGIISVLSQCFHLMRKSFLSSVTLASLYCNLY